MTADEAREDHRERLTVQYIRFLRSLRAVAELAGVDFDRLLELELRR